MPYASRAAQTRAGPSQAGKTGPAGRASEMAALRNRRPAWDDCCSDRQAGRLEQPALVFNGAEEGNRLGGSALLIRSAAHVPPLAALPPRPGPRAGFFFEANVPPLWIGVRVHMDLRSKSA